MVGQSTNLFLHSTIRSWTKSLLPRTTTPRCTISASREITTLVCVIITSVYLCCLLLFLLYLFLHFLLLCNSSHCRFVIDRFVEEDRNNIVNSKNLLNRLNTTPYNSFQRVQSVADLMKREIYDNWN